MVKHNAWVVTTIELLRSLRSIIDSTLGWGYARHTEMRKITTIGSRSVHGVLASAMIFLLIAWAPVAHAVPSFARQTGMACEACHTIFPELTHFGRMFKANGYTLDNLKQVRDMDVSKHETLSLAAIAPISAMAQLSNTWVKSPLPDGTGAPGKSQVSTTGFPQQFSFFYAGKVAPHLGAFVQITYGNDSGTVGIDNTDLRFADNLTLNDERSLIYGVSLNNNPTVQDLWNTTPAWGYPYSASNATVSPLAATQIDGTLAQDVAGLSAYAMWDESVYAEFGVYRSAKQGVTNTITGAAGPLDGTVANVISGVAPYFRFAYEKQFGRHDIEVGTYGATFKLIPGGGSTSSPALLSGPSNRFKDVAEDVQYQFMGDEHLFSVNGTRIHESMTLDASYAAGASNARDDLTTMRLQGVYYFRRKFGGALSRFQTTGSTDALLYPQGALPGVITSANGKPDTKGWVAEANYVPWLNTKFSLQYTAYTEFNGGSRNYDGFGRNAAANGSTYLLLWIAF